jgi:hypothetical protein
MKPGDCVETAIWLSGEETEEQILRWKREECPSSLQRLEREHAVTAGPLTFTVKSPGDDRVPAVPDHITGPDVRLLIAEAMLFPGKPRVESTPGFVADLQHDDLMKLRQITKRAHFNYRGYHPTDADCDAIIESLGIEAAMRTLRDGAAIN